MWWRPWRTGENRAGTTEQCFYFPHNLFKPIFCLTSASVGHHSTSDDSSAYRSLADLDVWQTTEHPAAKLRNYMQQRGWWSEAEEKDFVLRVRKQVLKQIAESEKLPKPQWQELFRDVYDEQPQHLK